MGSALARLDGRTQQRIVLVWLTVYLLLAQRLYIPRGPGEAVPIMNVLSAIPALFLMWLDRQRLWPVFLATMCRAWWLIPLPALALALPLLGVVSGYPLRTAYGIQLAIGYIAFTALGITYFTRGSEWRELNRALAAVAVVQFFVGLSQALLYSGTLVGWLTRWIYPWDRMATMAYGTEHFGGRSMGLFINPLVYSMLGAMLLVSAFAMPFSLRGRLAVALPSTGILVLGASRGSVLALTVLAAIPLVRWLARMTRKRRSAIITASVVVSAIGLGLALAATPALVLRFAERWASLAAIPLEGLNADRNTAVRLGAWEQAAAFWWRHPAGSFGPPQMAAGTFFDNDYVYLLVQGGPLLIAAYLIMMWGAWSSVGKCQLCPAARGLSALTLLTGLTQISLTFAPVIALLWFLIGGAATCEDDPVSPLALSQDEIAGADHARLKRTTSTTVVLIGLLAVVAVLRVITGGT